LEWILQKTTELGISEIRLLAAEHSVLKIPPEKVQAKLERWNKIILGAAKQCRRSTLPHLYPPGNCASLCQSLEADLKLVLSEDEKQLTLKTLLRRSTPCSVAFCVGPEGGWSLAESEMILRCAIEPVSLGPNILRTETAAIVTTAILKYELDFR
jgi:16S rRNA (uracil1498-N3)-methyltransferase